MNEARRRFRYGTKGEMKRQGGWCSCIIKPTGKFWKRYFNKKVRKGSEHKRGNWLEWS